MPLSSIHKQDRHVVQDSIERTLGTKPDTPVEAPVHQTAYQSIRRSLLFGDFAPGQALTIQGLIAQTSFGMTPVREAIRRLTSEGALVMLNNRRLMVPLLTAADAEQLHFIRSGLEPELARHASKVISQSQIARLRELDDALNDAIRRGDIPNYLQRNYEFHQNLYAAAKKPILAETVDRLWLRFGPSLRIVCGRIGTHNLPDKHADILIALQSQDADAAAQATKEDVAQGMAQILHSIPTIDSK